MIIIRTTIATNDNDNNNDNDNDNIIRNNDTDSKDDTQRKMKSIVDTLTFSASR